MSSQKRKVEEIDSEIETRQKTKYQKISEVEELYDLKSWELQQIMFKEALNIMFDTKEEKCDFLGMLSEFENCKKILYENSKNTIRKNKMATPKYKNYNKIRELKKVFDTPFKGVTININNYKKWIDEVNENCDSDGGFVF